MNPTKPGKKKSKSKQVENRKVDQKITSEGSQTPGGRHSKVKSVGKRKVRHPQTEQRLTLHQINKGKCDEKSKKKKHNVNEEEGDVAGKGITGGC